MDSHDKIHLTRPRALSVEYAGGRSLLFVECEGDALFVRLFANIEDTTYSISSIEVLAIECVHFVHMDNCQHQLKAFAQELGRSLTCQSLLFHERKAFNAEYCYPMKNEDVDRIVGYHRPKKK